MKFKYIGHGKDSPKKIKYMNKIDFVLDGDYVDVPTQFIAKISGNKCFKAEQKIIDVIPVDVEEEKPVDVKKGKKVKNGNDKKRV